jgi:ankyrin repeat protein
MVQKNIYNLPWEILYLICRFLAENDPKSLLRLASSSSRMHGFLQDATNHTLWSLGGSRLVQQDPLYNSSYLCSAGIFGLYAAINMNNSLATSFILRGDRSGSLNRFRLDLYGYSPLMVATATNAFNSAHLLLQHSANVNDQDNLNYTALHKAAYTGNASLVRELLDSGADVNAVSLDNLSPLHLAAKLGNREACEILLQNGADTNIKSASEGHNVLHTSAMSKRWDNSVIVKMLIERDPSLLEDKDNRGRTPLHLAIIYENGISCIQTVLKSSYANVNAQDYEGCSPLHYALIHDDQGEVCKTLVAFGANIYLRDFNGTRPIDNVSEENLSFSDMRSILVGRSKNRDLTILMFGILSSLLIFVVCELGN